jgi:hypothetical protein
MLRIYMISIGAEPSLKEAKLGVPRIPSHPVMGSPAIIIEEALALKVPPLLLLVPRAHRCARLWQIIHAWVDCAMMGHDSIM